MKNVIHLLSFLPLFLAALAALTPLTPAFIPRIGLLPLYRMRFIRALLLLAAWMLAIIALVNASSTFALLILLSIPTLIIEPGRIFVALDDPKHIPASQTDLPDEALVLGCEVEGDHAVAWPFETLVPRHVINDRCGDTPVLVAY